MSRIRRCTGVLAVWSAALLVGSCTGGTRTSDQRPLTIAMGSPPTTLDPHLHDESVTYMVLSNVFEGLTGFDREMQVRPVLAANWDNPDERTWRIHLRPNVRFQDGRPMTSADVVFSLRRAQTLANSRVGHYLVAVTSVRALDSLTVELHTDRPYPILLNKLSYVPIVPDSSPPVITKPVGTGPYRVVSSTPSRIELAAFDKYWGGAPAESRAVLVFDANPDQRATMLRQGAVDMAMLLRPRDVPAVQSDSCCRVAARTGLAVSYLGVDVSQPAVRDVRVREAISLAIDRREVADSVYRGFAKPSGEMVSSEVFGYVPDIAPPPRDTARARKLLAEAGYPHGFSLTVETTEPREPEADMIARQLAQVGITLQVTVLPWEQLYPRLNAGQVRAYIASVACISGDASDLLDAYMHTHETTLWGQSNWTRFSDRRLDSLVENATEAADMRDRKRLLQEAVRRANELLPFIPLWTLDRIYAMREGVSWEPRLDGMVRVADVRRTR